jgi:fatty-acid desaturase
VAALILLWSGLVGWTELAILVGTYLATGLGVTVGYHRLPSGLAWPGTQP